MHDLFDLTGRCALITGSSRGIGRSIAEALAAAGANVVISARNQAACDEVAEAINALKGGRAFACAANVGDRSSVEALVEAARAQFGPLGILVCNAASSPYRGPLSGISDEAFEKTLRNNVLGSHWLSQMAAKDMIAQREGSIIFVGSIGGFRGSAVIGAYNVSKAAEHQLARNLAVEFGPFGVRVNSIAPGIVKTDFSRKLWEDEQNAALALTGTPLGRIAEPDDIAGTAVFLAAKASRHVTGQTIIVDGGATITVGGL